jgi:hypothetical protein
MYVNSSSHKYSKVRPSNTTRVSYYYAKIFLQKQHVSTQLRSHHHTSISNEVENGKT